jgi:hypothetical protein
MAYLYPLHYRGGLGGLPSFITANPSVSGWSSCGQCRILSHACNFCLSYVEPVLCAFYFSNLLYGVVWHHQLRQLLCCLPHSHSAFVLASLVFHHREGLSLFCVCIWEWWTILKESINTSLVYHSMNSCQLHRNGFPRASDSDLRNSISLP